MSAASEPRFAYQDPAALAWTAQMFRTAHRRRLARLAAEEAQGRRDDAEPTDGGGDDG